MKCKLFFLLNILFPLITFAQSFDVNISLLKKLVADKKNDGAIVKASEMLASQENSEVYYLRGKAHYQLRNYKSAISDNLKSLEIKDNADARLTLVFAYQGVKDSLKAESMLKQNLDLYPDHIPTILTASFMASYKKQNDLALKILTDAYKKSDSPSLLQARAVEYGKQGNYEKALADYETILSTRKSSSIYLPAASSASLAGNSKKALDYYNQYLTINPNSSTALNNVGNELRKMGKFTEAEVYFKKAIDVSPKNIYPMVGQTFIAYHKGDLDKAYSIIDAAIFFDTKSKLAYTARGDINFLTGDLAAAETDLKQALTDPLQVKNAYPLLTKVYIYKGEYARALDFINQYIEKQRIPSAEAYNIRGLAYYKLGKNQEAIKDYLHALELKEDYQPVYKYLSDANKKPVDHYTHIQFLTPFSDVNYSKSGFHTDEKKDMDFKIRIISKDAVDPAKIVLNENGKAIDSKYLSLKNVEKQDFKFMDMIVTDVSYQYTPVNKKNNLKVSYIGSETQTQMLLK